MDIEKHIESMLPEINFLIKSYLPVVQPIINREEKEYREYGYRLSKIYINAVSRMLIHEFCTINTKDESLAMEMFKKMRGL